MSKQSQYAILLFVVVVALVYGNKGGGILPLVPVDSPFPSEGYWLLTADESQELTGVSVVANAASIRNEPGLESRYLDYDQTEPEPWQSALNWAKEKSGGKPYYVIRKGNRASEGPLTGDAEEMLATLNKAIGGVR